MIHESPSRVTIARSLVDSVDAVSIRVRHMGRDHFVVVSVERSGGAVADISFYPEPAPASVPYVCQRASNRALVKALRARIRDDRGNWRLLSIVSTTLHDFGVDWASALADDIPAAQPCPGLEVMVAV
jgi:hypothetical protein